MSCKRWFKLKQSVSSMHSLGQRRKYQTMTVSLPALSFAASSLFASERQRFLDLHPHPHPHPRSLALGRDAAQHFYLASPCTGCATSPARPACSCSRPMAHLICADGLAYSDFCLGDTGAMFGHSPTPIVHRPTGRTGSDLHAAVHPHGRSRHPASRHLWPAAMADGPDRQRCQPLRAALGPRRDAAPAAAGV